MHIWETFLVSEPINTAYPWGLGIKALM